MGPAEGLRRDSVPLLSKLRIARSILRNAHRDPAVRGEPLVSVVLATWNWSSVLRYAIRSVLWQTYPNLELLVIGDGCSDDSETVVASFGDERVRWHNLPENSGSQAIPNNIGLDLAQGEYVAYQGHDDVWHPKHLATLIAGLQQDSADFGWGLAEVLGPPGSRVRFLTGTSVGPLPIGHWLPPASLVHDTTLGRQIGGWRTWEDGGGPPDMNFLGRAQAEARQMIRVPALTSFKFPSALRPNVYRERPSHEQRAYVRRIERERTFIERELAALALRWRSPRAHDLGREALSEAERADPEAFRLRLRRIRGLD